MSDSGIQDKRRTDREQTPGDKSEVSSVWQDGVIRPSATIFSVGGLLVAALSLIRDRGTATPRTLFFLVLMFALAIALARRARWQTLAWLFVATLTFVGISFPATMGLRFSPMLVAALGVTVAASLLGRRAAIAVLLIVGVSLVGTGYGVSQGWFVLSETESVTSLGSWMRASLLFMSVSAALAVVVSGVVRSQQALLSQKSDLVTKLERSQEQLALALRGTNDGWWDWNLLTNQLWYAPRWWAMLGYDVNELPNDASLWRRLTHPDDLPRLEANIADILTSSDEHLEIETRLQHKDGRYIPVLARAFVQRDASGRAIRISGTNTDLTERQRADALREQMDRKLQETQKLESLGVLAGGIAHDFNNLLTGVLGNASLAMLDVPPNSRQQEYLNAIYDASMRASELCRQMLAYSGKGRFVVQLLQLDKLVEETTQLLQLSISKKAALRFQLEPALPVIEGDATQIRQVIMNLVINASEALGDDGGVITIGTGRTRVDLDYAGGTRSDLNLREGDYVHLEVADTGVGMTSDTQARIFDPFFTTKFTGRGLGLAAVLGIMRGHHGALKVYSEPGRGSTFKLLFPVAQGVPADAPPSTPQKTTWRGSGDILVVDDEPSVRRAAKSMVEVLGFHAVQAVDGREAVDIFGESPDRFVAVLLDLTMPRLDGHQTFAELRRIKPQVRVVLMSGFNEQEAIAQFTGKGLASFVQKPFSLDALRNALESAVRQS